MTTGRSAEILGGLLNWRSLLPSVAVVAAGVALLAAAVLFRARAEDRFDRLRAEHRRLTLAVQEAREERGNEAAIRRALAALEARVADEGDLRAVFDPIVTPGKGSGVETKAVSYQVRGAWGHFEAYEIRFSAAGRYPDVARFLARLETGRPGFAVDNVSIRKGEKEGVSADVAVRVIVR